MQMICLIFVFCPLLSQSPLPQSPDPPPIAATVGKHEITVARVQRHLKKVLGDENFGEGVRDHLLGESLEHLVRRHAVLQAIQKDGVVAGAGELRLEMEKLKDRLKEIELSMDEYLVSKNLQRSELEYEFLWRLSWEKYLKKHLTDEQLEKYFSRHRRQFDGTEMHVAHLLLSSLKQKTSELHKLAKKIKTEIQEGKTDWEKAVNDYSTAKSSSDQGGEIGWVSYDGPMSHEFCQAAMELNVGKISEPVQTIFGVHLIKCLEVRPGKLGPKDAEVALREAATRFLFETLAEKHRQALQIEYKVDWPKPKR